MDDLQFLHSLVDTLDEATPPGFGWLNKLVRVEDVDDGEGFELGMLDIEDHPSAYLMGFTAPPEWRALGVLSGAWAGPLAAPGERQVRPSAHPDATRARVIALTARSGAEVNRLQQPNEPPQDLGPAEGVIADCLRRAFGLPTPPPPAPPQHLLALRWVEALLAGWAVDLPESLPGGASWELFQRRLMAGEWNDEYNLTPEDAAWMDLGMFARWLLGGHQPLPALLRELDTTIGKSAAKWARREVNRLLAA